MKNEFKDRMSQLSNTELIEIVTIKRDKYQPIAIDAAEEELKNRNLDQSHFENVNIQVEIKNQLNEDLDSRKVSSYVRFINMLIDTICYLILWFIILFILILINQPTNDDIIVGLSYLSFFLAFLSYYILMEFMFQKTVGKFIMKCSVVTLDGKKPTIGTIVGRTLCRFIPFDNFTFLFMKNGIHDHFSNTIVIR